jgi:polyisoprenoid-binding protein YceI
MSRPPLPVLVGGLLVVVALGGFLVFQQFLAGDSVPALTLAPTSTPVASATSDPGNAPSATPVATEPASEGISGKWTVASGSLVGYRVRESLGGVSALTDAVGRTEAVVGSALIEATGTGARVLPAAFVADLTQLKSDDSRRDNRLRTRGIESDRFPEATFTLTSPLEVGSAALSDASVDVALSGDLTIHGVTRSVTIAGQARLNGDRIEIVASLTFPFSDFGMTPPDIAGFVQVEDEATLEVLLSLVKALN